MPGAQGRGSEATLVKQGCLMRRGFLLIEPVTCKHGSS